MPDYNDPRTMPWLRGLLTGAAISSCLTIAMIAAYGTWWAGLPFAVGTMAGVAFMALATGPGGMQ